MFISIVILHYNDFEMTRKYVENLKSLNWGNIAHKFVIVDNGSPDGSGVTLRQNYSNDKEIKLILLDKNLGFAKGNNVGISYSYNDLKANLVVVSNSDISIKDKDLPEKLVQIYEQTHFAVYGPDIFSLSKNIHQNPLQQKPISYTELSDRIKKLRKNIAVTKFLVGTHLYDPLRKFNSKVHVKNHCNAFDYDKPQSNVVLHGAFFVLSDLYLKAYPDGLYDKTFLYMEENILAFRCSISNLLMRYDPAIKVIHYDGVSSLKEAGSRGKKSLKEFEETLKSAMIYKQYIEEINKQKNEKK